MKREIFNVISLFSILWVPSQRIEIGMRLNWSLGRGIDTSFGEEEERGEGEENCFIVERDSLFSQHFILSSRISYLLHELTLHSDEEYEPLLSVSIRCGIDLFQLGLSSSSSSFRLSYLIFRVSILE